MKIKVEPFLMKKGNRLAKAAIEFEESDGPLAGFHFVGFTICEDAEKGVFVMFPSAANFVTSNEGSVSLSNRKFYFLRPSTETGLSDLESEILDVYDSMVPENQKTKRA